MITASSLRLIHTVASLRSDHGGPARSISSLCSHLSARDAVVDLVTLAPRSSEGPPVLPATGVKLHFVAERNSWPQLLSPRSGFERELAKLIAHARSESGVRPIIHDHGLWLPTNHIAARCARRHGVDRIVSPRGMLSAWALDYRGWKKRIASRLYQRADLKSAVVIHATSEQEARDIQALDLRRPIAVVPNGVEMAPVAIRNSRAHRTALFLSRLHPVKGVLYLLEGWARVQPPGWRLVVAGPDDGGHGRDARELALRLGLNDSVSFVGPVQNENKWQLYQSADLFVLPTFSENFGIVIAEALSSGIPVITTRGAPWAILEQARCGWWIDVGVDSLVATLREATGMGAEKLHEMGRLGRELVRREFAWDSVASRMMALYEWISSGVGAPNYVHQPELVARSMAR